MNQRLVWNFEFTPKTLLPLSTLDDKKEDQLKWELRYFWPESEIIILNAFDKSLLDIANYQQKNKEDYYFLLPEFNYNIKRRHNKLLYKPLLQNKNQASGYGTKIILDDPQSKLIDPDLHTIIERIENEGMRVNVKKEAFVYKFSTKPIIKMELARLEVLNKIYFSLSIEGKSFDWVETIAQTLLKNQNSCDYVTFLKNILKL